ncbi:MAG: hypothetical protein LBQ14_04490 [Treponema sp.]|jgi:hypothetical protein|nr:hypothetical protein [Treponema sp.]
MKKGTLTEKSLFSPLLLAVLLLAACDSGVILNSSDPPDVAVYPPSGMWVKALSSSRVEVSWTPVPAAVQYRIFRDTSPAGAFPLVASVTPPSPPSPVYSYEDAGLAFATYYYKVSAVGAGGDEQTSGYSPVIPLTQLQTPVPRGSAPSPVSIRLDWDAVPDAAGYAIYRADVLSSDPPPPLPAFPLVPSFSGTTYYDVAPTGTYYNYTRSYYYWVRALGPPDSDIASLPTLNGVIQGIQNTKAANPLTLAVPGTPLTVTSGLPSGTVAYYFFSTAASVTYKIEFSSLANSDGVRFSVFLETTGGQSQLLNIIDAGGPDPGGKDFTFTSTAAGVVLISSGGRTNSGNFSVTRL